jgi:hypothetical protein
MMCIKLSLWESSRVSDFHHLGFTDNEFDYDLEFIEPDLQQIAVIEKLHQATTKTYMLALSKDQVRSYQLTEHAPALMCESPVNLYQQYIVKANKTACVEKTSSSPFELCQTEHRFTLDVSDVHPFTNSGPD